RSHVRTTEERVCYPLLRSSPFFIGESYLRATLALNAAFRYFFGPRRTGLLAAFAQHFAGKIENLPAVRSRESPLSSGQTQLRTLAQGRAAPLGSPRGSR